MKKGINRAGQGKMKFSRLVIYLFLVALVGFVNVFMSQNTDQSVQTGEAERVFNEFQNEPVKSTPPPQVAYTQVRL
jgi:hypothetical protein